MAVVPLTELWTALDTDIWTRLCAHTTVCIRAHRRQISVWVRRIGNKTDSECWWLHEYKDRILIFLYRNFEFLSRFCSSNTHLKYWNQKVNRHLEKRLNTSVLMLWNWLILTCVSLAQLVLVSSLFYTIGTRLHMLQSSFTLELFLSARRKMLLKTSKYQPGSKKGSSRTSSRSFLLYCVERLVFQSSYGCHACLLLSPAHAGTWCPFSFHVNCSADTSSQPLLHPPLPSPPLRSACG